MVAPGGPAGAAPPGRRRASLGRAARLLLALAPAIVVGALARLERTDPLWLRPGLWRAGPGPAVPAGDGASRPGADRGPEGSAGPSPFAVDPGSRLVLAFHYPWYGTPSGPAGRWRHWNHPRVGLPGERVLGFHDPDRVVAGRPDLAAAHQPLGGPYDSRDPAVIRRQMAEAREAALDGFVVSWWGRESDEARAFGLLLAAARSLGLRLAPYYETGELWARGAPEVAADLAALLVTHGADPAFLRAGGRPVVFAYGAHRLRPAAWAFVRRALAARGLRPVLVGDAARPEWLAHFDALHLYSPVGALADGADLVARYRDLAARARAAGRPFLAPVAPGYDDRAVRVPGTVVARAEGATYGRTWEAALAAEPAAVLVATWNEWHEGTEIEPSVEHGRSYLTLTRRWAARFRERSAPPGPPGP